MNRKLNLEVANDRIFASIRLRNGCAENLRSTILQKFGVAYIAVF